MAKQTISFGTPPLGIGGDTYKSAFEKCNANFTELYSVMGMGIGLKDGQAPTTMSAGELNDPTKWRSGVFKYSDATLPGTYGHIMRFGGGTSGTNGGWFVDIAYTTSGAVHLRYKTNGTSFGAWVQQANVNSNVASATKLQTARTIGTTGNSVVATSASFDGSANISLDIRPKRAGYTANTKTQFRTDVIGSSAASDFINVGRSETAVTDICAAYSPSINFGTGDTHGFMSMAYNTAAIYVGAGNANKLNWTKQLAFTDSSITGNAATATKLQTARTINGTSFNGSANITTANWGTARTLSIGRTGKSVNGSANVAWTADEILPTGTNGQVLKHNGTSWVAGTDSNTTYSAMSATEANTGTATTGRVITAAVLKGAIQTHAPVQTSVTGNAGSATKLQTARTINGTSFNGSANITTANWGTARSLTVGNTGKSVNGSANVSWSLAEIGAVPAAGGSVTGKLTLTSTGTSWIGGTGGTTVPIQLTASSASSWHPWIQQKTSKGNGFAIGQLGETWSLSYATKANIDAGTNATVQLINVTSAGVSITGTLKATGTITGTLSGNASTATKLKTARKINGVAFDGSADITIAAGGQFLGNATTKAIAYNAQTIAENITIPSTYNGLSAGPITINSGYTVTISDGATWTIV